jgi:hypothetical protein
MAAWEYKRIQIKTRGGILRRIDAGEDYAEAMNVAGREGWEFVQAVPLQEVHGRTGAIDLIFKRPR